MAVSLLPINQV